MKNSEIIDVTADFYDQVFLKADGFDDAFIGVSNKSRLNTSNYVLTYSIKKCITILVGRDKMTYDEAREYLEFNVLNAYVGDQTPMFVDDEMF